MTSTTTESSATTPTSMLTFGGFAIPVKCRRIFITAQLEPSNGDPRIQPTGFPDLGPVLYADPAEKLGLICLIESEASMANRLEDVCLANKYDGTLRDELQGVPYITLTADGKRTGEFKTASTIDGHRFASEYIMCGHVQAGKELTGIQTKSAEAVAPATGKKKAVKEPKTGTEKPEFVRFVQSYMGMTTKDRCPAANVPRMFSLAMEYDPLSLLHGFQISVKDKLTFVGLRSPRAITASILGLNCQRITVPGVRLDPIGTGDAGQAIFQKQRVSAKNIEARFCIDVGLLASMTLDCGDTEGTEKVSEPSLQEPRLKLLLAIAMAKIAWLLLELKTGLRLRTDCDLRLVMDGTRYWTDRIDGLGTAFDFKAIASASKSLPELVKQCGLDPNRSPFVLKHVVSKKKDAKSLDEDVTEADDDEGATSDAEDSGE